MSNNPLNNIGTIFKTDGSDPVLVAIGGKAEIENLYDNKYMGDESYRFYTLEKCGEEAFYEMFEWIAEDAYELGN